MIFATDPKPMARAPAPCWINDVQRFHDGVRIFCSQKGGPLFVTRGDGTLFRPNDAPELPAYPGEAVLEARAGETLWATN